MPLGRKKRGWMTRSLGFSSSDGGVWSPANSLAAVAPTRLSSTPRTLMVRVMSPVFAWINSFTFTSREGFTFCPATSTWPLRQAAEARLRVLKILTAQSHLSILIQGSMFNIQRSTFNIQRSTLRHLLGQRNRLYQRNATVHSMFDVECFWSAPPR